MMKEERPKLYGLVLAGGKSTRMGSDKGLLNYHGEPQQEYLYKLLEQVCDKVFLSMRQDQQEFIPKGFNVIADQNIYRGPYNGILSAHDKHPNVAWLVLACDLPLLDLESIQKLVANRNPKVLATSYATEESGLPEPLITIWEPEGLKESIEHLGTTESTCPRKFLINSDIQLAVPEHDHVLYNANSLADYEFAKSKLD